MVMRFVTALLIACAAETLTANKSVDETIRAMTPEQKIAQLLIIGFDGHTLSDELRRSVTRGIGGVVFYAYNVESPAQAKQVIAAIREASGPITPFVAIDQEGGIVHRLRFGVPVIPSNMALGATRSHELARRAGRAVGSGLRDLGFTMNFAPVLDVLSDHRNAAIGTRAFSDDPGLVAELGSAFIEGQNEAGIISVAKHFPGQGGVREDTHKTLPALDAPIGTLRRRELVPFEDAFQHGLGAVMTAHIALPQIAETPTTPASLSRRVLQSVLRDELRFDGIVITDALQMKALESEADRVEVALRALNAGADMILNAGTAAEREQIYEGLLAAYRSGRLRRTRVDRALRRILTAKRDFKRGPSLPPDSAIVQEIAAGSITVIGSDIERYGSLAKGGRVAYVGADNWLKQQFASGTLISVPRFVGEASGLVRAATEAARHSTVIIAVAATRDQADVARRVHDAARNIPMIFVSLGLIDEWIDGENVLSVLAYAEDQESQSAVARVLRGETRASGKYPLVC
jgi:beta-N-acetylhexosaminidase